MIAPHCTPASFCRNNTASSSERCLMDPNLRSAGGLTVCEIAAAPSAPREVGRSATLFQASNCVLRRLYHIRWQLQSHEQSDVVVCTRYCTMLAVHVVMTWFALAKLQVCAVRRTSSARRICFWVRCSYSTSSNAFAAPPRFFLTGRNNIGWQLELVLAARFLE